MRFILRKYEVPNWPIFIRRPAKTITKEKNKSTFKYLPLKT